jgi:hypothetical protein
MPSSRRPHSKWRKFTRKYGTGIFFGLLIIVILGVVALLMYVMSNPEFRTRN